jgi:hypothetical protein
MTTSRGRVVEGRTRDISLCYKRSQKQLGVKDMTIKPIKKFAIENQSETDRYLESILARSEFSMDDVGGASLCDFPIHCSTAKRPLSRGKPD